MNIKTKLYGTTPKHLSLLISTGNKEHKIHSPAHEGIASS